MSSFMNDDALNAMDENTDLKARILRLEYENSTLRSILDSIRGALGNFGRGPKPAPLVVSDFAAANLIKSGVFKPGQVINVGAEKMFISASGQLRPVKYFPDMEKYTACWESRGYYSNDILPGDCVNVKGKLYRIDDNGGLIAYD